MLEFEMDVRGAGSLGRGARPFTDEEEAALRWSDEVGLTPFLLKFGEGLGKQCIHETAR